MSIGENLKNARKSRGYTQAELAEKVGLTQSMIAHLESDIRVLSLPLAVSIAETLECSVMDFVQEHKGA